MRLLESVVGETVLCMKLDTTGMHCFVSVCSESNVHYPPQYVSCLTEQERPSAVHKHCFRVPLFNCQVFLRFSLPASFHLLLNFLHTGLLSSSYHLLNSELPLRLHQIFNMDNINTSRTIDGQEIPSMTGLVERKPRSQADEVIHSFVMTNCEIFRELDLLREQASLITDMYILITDFLKGWSSPEGDLAARKQQERADNADLDGRARFYDMMIEIATQMQQNTDFLACISPSILKHVGAQVLDICMAPGGYAAAVLNYNPKAEVYGITLARNEGGHIISDKLMQRIKQIEYQDVTFYIPQGSTIEQKQKLDLHEEKNRFIEKQPFGSLEFDLIFCDGQTLRTHKRSEYRGFGDKEPVRLRNSQLIIALDRIKTGGTMVIKLHNLGDDWETARFTCDMTQFCTVKTFKPQPFHGHKGSFYLICSNVNRGVKLTELREKLAAQWWILCDGSGEDDSLAKVNAERLVMDWGHDLIRLGKYIWDDQRRWLSSKNWARISGVPVPPKLKANWRRPLTLPSDRKEWEINSQKVIKMRQDSWR